MSPEGYALLGWGSTCLGDCKRSGTKLQGDGYELVIALVSDLICCGVSIFTMTEQHSHFDL